MVRTWLEGSKARGMALGLDSTRAMLARLGNPQLEFTTIQVAGSNGKGTACALLGATLVSSGVGVGIFTSPHLCRVEERIRIQGKPISALDFDTALQAVREAADGSQFEWKANSLNRIEGEAQQPISPTFFETTYLSAMVAFAIAGVEYGIVEVGLGGRLDATSTCEPAACLLTNISLEHTEILGDTLEQVITEKAAIASPATPLLARLPEGMETEEMLGLLREVIPYPLSEELLHVIEVNPDWDYLSEAAHLCQQLFSKIGLQEEADLVDETLGLMRWPARMQSIERMVGDFPIEVLMDAAHNPSGMKRLLPNFEKRLEGRNWGLLIGASPQNDLDGFLDPICRLAERQPPILVVCTEPQGGRYQAISSEGLADSLRAVLPAGIPLVGIPNPCDAWQAWEAALAAAGGGEAVLGLSTGSLYLQGNLLTHLKLDSDEELSLM